MQQRNWWERLRVSLMLATATAAALPGQTFTTLESFNGPNGAGPAYVSLVQGLNGSLYGTTLARRRQRRRHGL